MIERLKAGDHDAFEAIYMKYFKKVEHLAFLLLQDRDVAEDLTQDIFVSIWNSRDKIDPSKNFNAFMYTVTKNSVFNHIKSRNVRVCYSSFVEREEEYIDNSSPDSIVEAKEMELLIGSIVSHMPEQRKRVFEMSRNAGQRNEEIATKLNITRNAVEKQLRLAISDLS